MRFNQTLLILSLILLLFTGCNSAGSAEGKESPALTVVLIMDGLRPDAITPETMPNLYKLQQEGVNFTNSHATIPTVTRVNSASLATGSYPGSHSIMSNSLYAEEFNPNGSVSTWNHKNLIKIDSITGGKLLSVPSVGEILHENNLKYVAISSGSPGSAFLQNHHVSMDCGVLIGTEFESGQRPAFPEEINREILSRFGNPPVKDDDDTYNETVSWAEDVLLDYVLPELKPQVVHNWFSEPDHTQHRFGTGSEEYYSVLKNNDMYVGKLMDKLKELGVYEKANVIVTSDHGMNEDEYGVNLKEAFSEGGIDPEDVIIASSGETVLLYLKDKEAGKIENIVRYLQNQEWTGVVFTRAAQTGSGKKPYPYGSVDGTFSLELIHMDHPVRQPDILFSFKWSDNKNSYGVPGLSYKMTGKTGPCGIGGGHGNISPWCIHNTFIAWGRDFKKGVVVDSPTGLVDVVPTVLSLYNINPEDKTDGRIISEALKNSPEKEKQAPVTEVLSVESADKKYRAKIQVSKTGSHWYIDKGWRDN